ncbi:MAG: hypothetical protein F6K08_29800, partial [Okeania sp. SIO1H6]|nr:hypothetical protein [Okeania sp. SIO1H6]
MYDINLVVVHSNGRESVGRWGDGEMGSMGEIKKYISSPKPIQDYHYHFLCGFNTPPSTG